MKYSTTNDYEPIEAKNGMEGIRLAKTENPISYLILTDLYIPVMNGFEVRKILKSDTSTKDIPCIALSVIKERKERFLKLDFVDYIAKPFDMHELIWIVNKHLR